MKDEGRSMQDEGLSASSRRLSVERAGLLLELRAGGQRWYVPRDHVDRLESVGPGALPAADERGRPVVVRDLAPLLGRDEGRSPGRRQALGVNLRRRAVLLLVDRVEGLEPDAAVRPLPPILRRRLAVAWAIGVVADGDAPALVLDLRRIAADVALGAV
jgi:hypothetical protein